MALLCDPAICDQIKAMGGHPERLVDLYIETINQAVAECLDDVVIAIHMCRGNFKGRYLGAGGYEFGGRALFCQG